MVTVMAATAPAWIPDWLAGWSFLRMELWKWAGIAVVLVGGYLLAMVLQRGILWLALKLAKLTSAKWDDELVQAGRGPLKLLLFGALIFSGSRLLQLPVPAARAHEILSRSLLVASLAWFLLRFLRFSTLAVQSTVVKPENAAEARSVRTHLTVLRSLAEVTIYVVAAALILMQFDIVRSVGVSLLASAGIAGLVIGFAAQKTLGNLLGGIQLSITQPVRIGDVVIVEGEYGTVEEIRLTYVVVQVWDLRRIVVPVSYFLERPFQNWSRTSTELLGTVTLQVDFSADVEAFRAELQRLLAEEGKALWDQKAQSVQITDSQDRTMTLRALVSAKDAGTLWDLRVLVREKLVAFLNQHPLWYPQTRNRVQEQNAALPGVTAPPADAGERTRTS